MFEVDFIQRFHKQTTGMYSPRRATRALEHASGA